MRERIPSEKDWRSEPWTLDTRRAYEDFIGKSRLGATRLFAENSLLHQEALMFMPARCFRFYVHAYIDHLLSEEGRGDSDGANCFFGIVNVRMGDILASPPDVRERIRGMLRHLGANQAWYDADAETYGDFRAMADEALGMLKE